METVERKETIEKLAKVLVSNEFESRVSSCSSMDEILAALKTEGVEVTEEELIAFFNSVNSPENEGDSLSEEDLESVTGGGLFSWIKSQINKIKKQFEYFFGGQYVVDIAEGKRKHPWVK